MEPILHSTSANAKRQAILDAALRLFSELGFHGTAVPLVAREAGVGTGTIYRYFDSKEALVNALYQHHKIAFTLSVLADFPVDAPIRAQFRALYQRLFRWALQNPDAFYFLELHHHAPYLDEESRALEERVLGRSVEFYQQAQTQQALKDVPPSVLIHTVWGAFVGIMKASRAGHLELTPQVMQHVEDCCWEAIRR